MVDVLVECPVCDRPIDPDATSCPNCGADFKIQGIDELEVVADRMIDGPDIAAGTEAIVPGPSQGLVQEEAPIAPAGGAKGSGPRKKGLLDKLLGRAER